MSEITPQENNLGAEEFPAPEAPPEQKVRVYAPESKVWVTYVILGVTILVYLLQMLSEFLIGGDYPAFLGMKINEYILAGQVWRLLTPVLLHGSIMHIGFNMLFLYRIGPGLEKNYGSKKFLILYLVSAFTGNVFSFLFTQAPSLGASTAIFGLVTALAVLIYRNQNFFRNSRDSLINIGSTIVINLFLGLSPGIDNFGHLGGLLGGLAIAWFAGPQFAARQELNGYHIFDQQPEKKFSITVLIVIIAFALLAVAKTILF